MTVTPTSRTWTRSALVVSTTLVALSLASPASARAGVDPATLNPPPPPEFNPVCSVVGSHITCDVAFRDPDVVNEPSGILCGDTELLISQSRQVVGKRAYNSNGDLLSRHFREDLAGTFTNPVSGRTALFVQSDTQIDDLTVPGHPLSGSTRISGSLRIRTTAGGTVLTDAGTAVIDDATGDILSESANHPLDAYFVFGDRSALQPLCDAVAGPGA